MSRNEALRALGNGLQSKAIAATWWACFRDVQIPSQRSYDRDMNEILNVCLQRIKSVTSPCSHRCLPPPLELAPQQAGDEADPRRFEPSSLRSRSHSAGGSVRLPQQRQDPQHVQCAQLAGPGRSAPLLPAGSGPLTWGPKRHFASPMFFGLRLIVNFKIQPNSFVLANLKNT